MLIMKIVKGSLDPKKCYKKIQKTICSHDDYFSQRLHNFCMVIEIDKYDEQTHIHFGLQEKHT